MHRLFLDANVLFSAAYRAKSGLLILWELERTALLTSPYAAEEARRNLEDDTQRSRLHHLLAAVHLVRDVARLPVTVDLPAKDIPILRSAIASGATHLLTGDVKHFGRFFGRKIGGVLILPPGQYLSSL
jgi:predicted nucleic acid-binding protein